ncbi:MocE family 2Fe-2S type ferredoxin [Pararhizobium sp. IMCC21322]|uniref:MocE family 2Fe-2S type ferredoxin n=1 Tax=Pararhizobium sp. IMCC21322 TaxID=3067903 RepID=UPI002741EDF2|nr:MocE family 2Fe-2S type ferredoxin [Pararhizobium sp. IMCC21322]
MTETIRACSTTDIDEEDVMRFDHGDKTYAIFHAPDGKYYATEGYCTHEKAHLGEGIVDEFEIECPLHFGSFDYRTGDPTVAPACVKLKTYPVKIEGNDILITVG